jgi:hypothetical protein
MASGAIEVRDEGTLRLMPRRAQNPQGLADAMSRFAEWLPLSDLTPHDRLSAASVWRGRRLRRQLSMEGVWVIERDGTTNCQGLPEMARSRVASTTSLPGSCRSRLTSALASK